VGYVFEWDALKSRLNVPKYGVTFDEATTVFGDPQAMLRADPDHSVDEMR
jgi:uncharacterized DUF497 family protein